MRLILTILLLAASVAAAQNPAARVTVLQTQHQKLDAIKAQLERQQQSLDRIEAALKAPAAPPAGFPTSPTPPPAGPAQPEPATPAAAVSPRVIECAKNTAGDLMWLITMCMGGQALTDADRAYLREIRYPGAEPVVTSETSNRTTLESGEFDFSNPGSYRIFRATAGASQKTLRVPDFRGRIRLLTGATSGNVANEVAMTVIDTTTGQVVMQQTVPTSYGDPSFLVEPRRVYLIRAEAAVPFALTVRIEPLP